MPKEKPKVEHKKVGHPPSENSRKLFMNPFKRINWNTGNLELRGKK